MANGANMIFDHCSITWGKDEALIQMVKELPQRI